jgi:hypothetical protein
MVATPLRDTEQPLIAVTRPPGQPPGLFARLSLCGYFLDNCQLCMADQPPSETTWPNRAILKPTALRASQAVIGAVTCVPRPSRASTGERSSGTQGQTSEPATRVREWRACQAAQLQDPLQGRGSWPLRPSRLPRFCGVPHRSDPVLAADNLTRDPEPLLAGLRTSPEERGCYRFTNSPSHNRNASLVSTPSAPYATKIWPTFPG